MKGWPKKCMVTPRPTILIPEKQMKQEHERALLDLEFHSKQKDMLEERV